MRFKLETISFKEIECHIEFDKLPDEVKQRIHQIKNSLKLTNGASPIPPIVKDIGVRVTTQGINEQKYQIIDGTLTVLAAKLLPSDYQTIQCFVLSKSEASIFSTLKDIQLRGF